MEHVRLAAAAGPAGGTVSEATAEARVWVSDGPRYRFPERESASARRPSTGVCFSGGGTRSLVATAGQLRGLTATGLIADVGYVACVSGGAWAAVPYTYHAAGARDDAELLGPVLPPERLRLPALAALPEGRLDHPATAAFEGHLAAAIGDADLPRDQVWTRAVGATYLAPFGLFDPRAPAWFTADDAAASAIRAANPHLAATPFHTVNGRAWRPHLVINASLVWPRLPAEPVDARQRIGFEFTPLGVGTPCRSTLRAPSGASCTVGGGIRGAVRLRLPGSRGRLRRERGGCAWPRRRARSPSPTRRPQRAPAPPGRRRSRSCRGRGTGRWSKGGGEPDREHSFADGGDVENFGLIALLRRRVERVVVFVNTLHPIADEVRLESRARCGGARGGGHRPLHPAAVRLPDPEVPAQPGLRAGGVPRRRGGAAARPAPRAGRSCHHAPHGGAERLVGGGRRLGGGGLLGLQRAGARLGGAPRRRRCASAIEAGQPPDPAGPFARFPFYRTEGQNPGCLVRLTAPQVNLLAELSCWVVVEHAAELGRVLRGGPG